MSNKGMLTLEQLKGLVKKGEVETVLAGFTDHYGRLMGKRFDAEMFVAEIDRALKAHELIKVRAGTMDRDQRDRALVSIIEKTRAEQVQQVGKVFVLYRKSDE